MMRWALLVAGMGLLLGPTPLWGVTRHVPLEYSTIQAALDASAVGDSVLVAPGTYTDYETRDLGTLHDWTACVFMPNGVCLVSEGGPAVTVIDAHLATGPQLTAIIARFVDSELTTIRGFTVTGAPAGTGGGYVVGRILFQDCVFRDLSAGQSTGGGMSANGDLTLIGCEFANCLAWMGGALYHANGRLEMYGCYVHDCGSRALQLAGNSEPPEESAWIEDCRFEDNWNNAGGGGALGIGQYAGGVTIRGCMFENNEDRGTGGGGISHGYIGQGSVIENCLFLNNRSIGGNGVGGGVSAGGAVTVRGCTFWGNYATTVGDAVGFFAAGSSLENNVIVHCTGPGGAIYLGRNMTLQSSCNVFWDNPGGLGGRYTPGPTDRIVDPLFCDPVGGDFRVATGSPCLPEGSIGCGLIGAFGEGCGVVAVDPTSWGKVKAAYRGGGVGR